MRRAIFLLLCCSACRPDFDLREPIYLVPEPDFANRCGDECREVIRRGIDRWERHWDALEDRGGWGGVYLVDVAPGAQYVALSIDQDNLEDSTSVAEFRWYASGPPTITLREYEGYDIVNGVVPLVWAHELGHVFGLDHAPTGACSVMEPSTKFYITPSDIQAVCDLHPEVDCPATVWCEGLFTDPWRCPSEEPTCSE